MFVHVFASSCVDRYRCIPLNMEARGQTCEVYLRNHHPKFFFETESLIGSVKLADQGSPVSVFPVLWLKAQATLESKHESRLRGRSFPA